MSSKRSNPYIPSRFHQNHARRKKTSSSSSQNKSPPRGSFLRRRLPFCDSGVSFLCVCVSLSLAERMKVFLCVEKVPSSLFLCGAECTRKKKDTKKKEGKKRRERRERGVFVVMRLSEKFYTYRQRERHENTF